MRAKKDQLVQAIAGRFAAHHGFVAREILDHIAFLDAAIARLTAEIVERTAPFEGWTNQDDLPGSAIPPP